MTPEQLKAIEDRLNAATPGPWELEGTSDGGPAITDAVISKSGTVFALDPQRDPPTEADALFVAHAPTDIRALLDYVRALEQQVSEGGTRL